VHCGYIRFLEANEVSAWSRKHTVRDSYDATSEGYEELYSEEQNRKFQHAIENVNSKGKVVMDAGCGSGLFFSHVAAQANLVVGVDISLRLLQKAKLLSRGFGNVEVVLADVDHLPFKGSVFGVVFAFTVLQNMPKPSETVSELKRISTFDAKMVLTGLKKAFELGKFMEVLEGSGMPLVAFVDEDSINCYIATLTA
jgi:ubiquinone/menaquinone biosynthesis C-methylase UbiE